jgi:hypothetical protein
MKENMHTTCTTIDGLPNYVLTESGFIYNWKTGRRLKRHWSSKGFFSLLPIGQGRLFRLFHKNPKFRLPEDNSVPPDLRMIPEYPNYGITPYGAVWRIQGKRKVTPHMVREEARGNLAFVQLVHTSGKRHNKCVVKLLKQIWDDHSQDEDDDD